MFRHEIHVAVTKALIDAIKNRTPTEYDNEPTYEVVKKYFVECGNNITTALCFCPNDDNLIGQLEAEIDHSSKYIQKD